MKSIVLRRRQIQILIFIWIGISQITHGLDEIFTLNTPKEIQIQINDLGSFKTANVSAANGEVELVSTPDVGAEEGVFSLIYTSTKLQNINHRLSITGTDIIEINVVDSENNSTTFSYDVITQPQPTEKNYLQPSHELQYSNIKVDWHDIRVRNGRDNPAVCPRFQGENEWDDYSGVGFADFNGDGYDDYVLHPQFNARRDAELEFALGLVPRELELYLYKDGSFIYEPIKYNGRASNDPLKFHLARKILVGDFDNDGDPDLYLVNHGTDVYSEITFSEEQYLLENTLEATGGFTAHKLTQKMAAHGATSGDIDGDGDLDIFTRGDNNPQVDDSIKFWGFLINNGNNSFVLDQSIVSPDEFWFWWAQFHFELVDVDEDGFLDLIMGGHEQDNNETNFAKYPTLKEFVDLSPEKHAVGRVRIMWGSNSKTYSAENMTIIPTVQDFGTIADLDVFDLNRDGAPELLVTRTGGSPDSQENYYGGHFVQIVSFKERVPSDITSDMITGNSITGSQGACPQNDTLWITWMSAQDYDYDGELDIYSVMVAPGGDERILHRWEWNGSRFIRVSPKTIPNGSNKQVYPATVCKAADPRNSLKLQSRESGLTNTEISGNIGITCAIPRDAFTGDLLAPTTALDVEVSLQKTTEDNETVTCTLNEFLGQVISDSESFEIDLNGTMKTTKSWNNSRPANNLTSYTITCDLPPQTAITSIETRAVY